MRGSLPLFFTGCGGKLIHGKGHVYRKAVPTAVAPLYTFSFLGKKNPRSVEEIRPSSVVNVFTRRDKIRATLANEQNLDEGGEKNRRQD